MSSSGSSRKKYESPRQIERQSNILSTARALLEDVGYAGMTMRGLAKKAGVAQGTLYNLYSSKDELIVAAVEDLLKAVEQRAFDGGEKQGIEAILAVAEAMAQQTLNTPNYAEAMTRALFRAQPQDPLVDALFARGLPFLRDQLAIAAAAGHLQADVDLEGIARQLLGQGWANVMLWMMGLQPLEDIVRNRLRSEILILLAVTKGPMRKKLEQRWQSLQP